MNTRGWILGAFLTGGCLENEEKIVVRDDGSVTITIAAHGQQMDDLADGYPVPLDPAWKPDNDDTTRWLASIGPDTGSADTKRAAKQPWLGADGKPREVRLQVSATFSDPAQIPGLFAPLSEPYRKAYLERAAALKVENRGARNVFVFERTFRRRDYRNLSFSEWLERHVPGEIKKSFENKQKLTPFQWGQVLTLVREALEHTLGALVERTLVDLYLRTETGLSTEAWRRIRNTTVAAALEPASRERLQSIRVLLERRMEVESADDGPDPFAELEDEMRGRLREKLAESLAAEGLPERVRNAVLESLERNLTAIGHTDDLGDESFKVEVEMPGVIVGGNYDSTDERSARYSFRGEDLRDRDVVLRVVSVVD